MNDLIDMCDAAMNRVNSWCMFYLPEDELRKALMSDLKASGRFPDEREAEILVNGGEDGDADEEIDSTFRFTASLIHERL